MGDWADLAENLALAQMHEDETRKGTPSVVFDLETGGLAESAPIIQLAAVAIDDQTGQELSSLEIKLQFDEAAADPAALKLNHYDPTVWAREARPAVEACDLFATWLKPFCQLRMVSKRTGRPYNVARLVGHNAATFDGPRLRAMFQAVGIYLPADPRVRCTVQQALAWFDARGLQLQSYRLTDLMQVFGLPVASDAHDALADVRMTIALYLRLRQQDLPAGVSR